MLLLQRAKEAEGNHKREMNTAALPPMPIVNCRVRPVSKMSNQPEMKELEQLKAFENSNPEMKKLTKSTLMVKWLEFTAAYVNPAIYFVFTVTFFAVSIILM